MRMTSWRGGRHVPFLLAVLGVGVVFVFLHRGGREPLRSERWDDVWLVIAAGLLALELPSLIGTVRRWMSGDGKTRVAAPVRRRPPVGLLLVPFALMTIGLTALAFAMAAVIHWAAELNVTAVVAITAIGFGLFGASILFSLRRLGIFSALQRRALRRALSRTTTGAA